MPPLDCVSFPKVAHALNRMLLVSVHSSTFKIATMSFAGFSCLVGTLYLFYLSLKILRYVLNFLKAVTVGGSIDLKQFGAWAGKVLTVCL